MTQQTRAVPTPSTVSATGSSRLLVAVLAAAGVVVAVAQTLIIPLVGDLPAIFNTTVSTASWAVTVTLLAGAVTMPVIGNLADLYGKKQLILAAMVAFVIGSLICATAIDVGVMILGRALQGVGTGMIPLALSFVHDVLPKERAGSAIALISASLGLGGALGLSAAAAIAQFTSWRMLFWATAVTATIITITIAAILPALRPVSRQAHRSATTAPTNIDTTAQPASFDVVGAIGLTLGLTALLLGIAQGPEWGWFSAWTLGTLGVAVVVLISWGIYQWHRVHPLVALRTFIHPVVLLTNIATIFFGFTMYAANLIIPQVLQLPIEAGHGFGQSMIEMGLWMAPLGLGVVSASGIGARISYRKTPKHTLIWAGVIIAVGYGAAAVTLVLSQGHRAGAAHNESLLVSVVLLSVAVFIIGCGMGFAYGATPALIMSVVPAAEKASANGINALVRSIGMTVSAAVIGSLLGGMSQEFGEKLIPTHAGFLIALLCGVGAALVATGIIAAVPLSPKQHATPPVESLRRSLRV